MRVIHRRPKNNRRYSVKGLAYSPDGRYLVAGVDRRLRDEWELSRDGRILRFDLFEPGSEPLEFTDYGVVDITWNPGGGIVALSGARVLAIGEDFETYRYHDLYNAGHIAVTPPDHEGPPGLWVTRSRHGGGGLYRFPVDDDVTFAPNDIRRDPAFIMESMALRPGDDIVAIGTEGAFILSRLTDSPTGTAVPIATGRQRGWVQHLVFSPDGRTLAAASGWRVVLWDVGEEVAEGRLREIGELTGHGKEVTGLAFTPDGRWLLSVGLDETVRLWNPLTGEEHANYDWGLGALRSVACAPDGMTAAVGGSGRKSIAVFDLD